MEKQKLIECAKEALQNAYAPYTNIKVGAALFTKEGRVYTGCNIENKGIQSICAERVALVKAISQGEKNFKTLVVISKIENEYYKILPCGYCRQFIQEFCDEDFEICTYDEEKKKVITYKLSELLPNAF